MNTAKKIHGTMETAKGQIMETDLYPTGVLQFIKNEVPNKKEPKPLHLLLAEMGLLPASPMNLQP